MKHEIRKIGIILLSGCGLIACGDASSNPYQTWQSESASTATGGAGAGASAFAGGVGGLNTGGTSGVAGMIASGGSPSSGGTPGSATRGDAAVINVFDGGRVDGSGTAGAPGTGGTPVSGGSPGTGGTSDTQVNVTTSQDPVIPPITGDCPVFTNNSTIDFNGLGGIRMAVGPKGNGGGSLIFYWHGTGSSNSEFSRLIPAASQQKILDAGGIIIAPQTTSGEGTDCSGTGTFFTGDLDTADQIVACAVRDHNIDPHRIYTTGCSAGGLFTGCMALNRPQYIAAAAPNSGGGMGRFASTDHIPAVMTMHGAPGTDVVIIDFSDSSAAFDNLVKTAGGFVINCNHGGRHCGAPAELYTAAIQFMLDHPYGVDPEPYASGLPASFPSYCSIF